MEKKVGQVVFIPIPAMMGHFSPMLEFAKKLSSAGCRPAVTFLLIPPFRPDADVSAFLSSLPSSYPSFSLHHLPALPLPADTTPKALIPAALDLYKPLLASALRTLLPISAVVLDFLTSNMVDTCLDLDLPPYVFFTSSASVLALMLHAHTLDVDGAAAVPFPAFASRVPTACLPDALVQGKDEIYDLFFRCSSQLRRASGILVNTFHALQPGVLKALEDGAYGPAPPVLAVGPVVSLPTGEEKGHECIRWLDRQPDGSVVFLCFGSGGRFGKEQVAELAVGLERSGHRFLWVLRASPAETRPDEVLPEGFVERTEGRGLVWPVYAPQTEVLRHPAVGGFVTHCGWNSSLEAMWFGVPTAAWPLYAEQHWNAQEMAAEMGMVMVVEAERWKGNWATAEKVERAVRLLMGEAGAGLTAKVRRVMEEAGKAVAVGGSSYRSLEQWAEGLR